MIEFVTEKVDHKNIPTEFLTEKFSYKYLPTDFVTENFGRKNIFERICDRNFRSEYFSDRLFGQKSKNPIELGRTFGHNGLKKFKNKIENYRPLETNLTTNIKCSNVQTTLIFPITNKHIHTK